MRAACMHLPYLSTVLSIVRWVWVQVVHFHMSGDRGSFCVRCRDTDSGDSRSIGLRGSSNQIGSVGLRSASESCLCLLQVLARQHPTSPLSVDGRPGEQGSQGGLLTPSSRFHLFVLFSCCR